MSLLISPSKGNLGPRNPFLVSKGSPSGAPLYFSAVHWQISSLTNTAKPLPRPTGCMSTASLRAVVGPGMKGQQQRGTPETTRLGSGAMQGRGKRSRCPLAAIYTQVRHFFLCMKKRGFTGVWCAKPLGRCCAGRHPYGQGCSPSTDLPAKKPQPPALGSLPC